MKTSELLNKMPVMPKVRHSSIEPQIQELVAKAKECCRQLEVNFLILGKCLFTLRSFIINQKFYLECLKDIGIKYRKAMILIQIYKTFVLHYRVGEAYLLCIGWSSLGILATRYSSLEAKRKDVEKACMDAIALNQSEIRVDKRKMIGVLFHIPHSSKKLLDKKLLQFGAVKSRVGMAYRDDAFLKLIKAC